MDWGFDGSEAEEETEERPEPRSEAREPREPRESGTGEEEAGGEQRSRRRRRRGRGRRDHHDAAGEPHGQRAPDDEIAQHEDAESEGAEEGTVEADESEVRAEGPREGSRKPEEGEGRGRRRRRGRRGGRSRQREGTAHDGSVIAGSPADPSADQPDVDPGFKPHGRWGDLPVRRRDEAPIETPDHGVTSQGITWEIVGAAQEPEVAAEPVPEAPPAAPAKPELIRSEPEPVAASPSSPAETSPTREPALANGSMSHAEATPQDAPSPESTEPEGPPRRGWWQRRFGGA
jgi:ribonuclease E